MAHKRILTIYAAALTTVLSCAALAQAPLQDPRTRIEAAMKGAAELRSLSFSESFKSQMVMNGKTDETALNGELLFREPGNLAGRFTADKQEIRVVSNGTVHYLYVVGNETYEKTENPLSRAQLMTVVSRGVLRPAGTWVANFLHNAKELLDSAEGVEQKGEQKIDGVDCDGYLLSYPEFDVTAWLTRSNPPVLRRTEMDLKKSLRAPGQEGGPVSANVQVDVTDWKPNAETTDAQFAFTPPDGVEMAKPEVEPPSIEGKPAKDFELPLLDGGTVKLSALKGKTVVLDFWATWCGPCRVAMPIVEKVTEAMADKGVVLYAVNQGEAPEVITKYLQTAKLNPKVALDKDGKASQDYGADSIPTIVLVGPDGVIRKVFKGVSPKFEDDLRGALSDIVKGAEPAK